MDDLPQSLKTLFQATEIDGETVGRGGHPGQNYLAYRDAKALGPGLNELFPEASPVGKLYLAALIREIVPSRGTALLRTLTSDRTVVTQMRGYIRSGTTVGAVARQLLDPTNDFQF